MAVSAAGAPLGSEQMDFENSALGELAEVDMLDGMGGMCYNSDDMYDDDEKGEERQGVPTDLFGVGEASAGPSALTRDEGEVLGAGVGTGATGGNAGATGAGASASAGELPAPPACEPDPREGGSSSSPPLRAPTPLEMLISNARELVTSLVRTRAPGPDGGCALISRWWSAPAAPSCRGSRFDSSCRAPRHGGTPLLLRGVGLALRAPHPPGRRHRRRSRRRGAATPPPAPPPTTPMPTSSPSPPLPSPSPPHPSTLPTPTPLPLPSPPPLPCTAAAAAAPVATAAAGVATAAAAAASVATVATAPLSPQPTPTPRPVPRTPYPNPYPPCPCHRCRCRCRRR